MSEKPLFENREDENKELKDTIEKQKKEIFRLKNVIENLPGSIYWKDLDGVYLGRNTYSLEKMMSVDLETDASQEDVVGKTDYDFFSKDVADTYRKHDLEVIKTGKETVKEEVVNLPNGETLIQLSSKKPLRDENGTIVGIVGNTVDITYLKTIENELREAKEKAEQANVVKTEFIRNMEHDIRTPFTGIQGLTDILLRHEIDDQKKELLSDIRSCTKELLDYANTIMEFARIEQGSRLLLERKFNLSELIESIVKIETPPAKSKKLALLLEYSDSVPPILLGDEHRLKSILINLLSNAIKFTKEGYVKLKIDLIQQIDGRNVLVRFTVKDTGIGISQDKQDFIYEKFSRIIPSNQGVYKGLGLGLRIVKQFIDEMGGEIDLKSVIGKGSTFACTIPFKLPLTIDMIDKDAE